MFASIPEILDELRAGRMVVVTDDEDRENEGDLILPAEFITPEAVNFMVRQAAGYLFLSLTSADCDRLDLHGQSSVNTSVRGTPLTVSIDGHPKHGFTTGVSAKERSATIKMAIDPNSGPDDFVRPGHINPLRSRDGGVLVRTGHTEGIVDLCRLAGLTPACVGIEVCRPDGEMARLPDLERFCAEHGLKMCSIAQIIEHRLARERLVRRLEPTRGAALRTPAGEFTLIAYESLVDPQPHVALTMGGVGVPGDGGVVAEAGEPTLVRVHRRNLLGDIFLDEDSGSGCSSGAVLQASMRLIAEAGRGAIVYLRPHAHADDGLLQRLHSVRHPRVGGQEVGHDPDRPELSPVEGSPWREVGIGSQILRDLGLKRLRLISNSKTEHPGLEAFGLEIVERVPIG